MDEVWLVTSARCAENLSNTEELTGSSHGPVRKASSYYARVCAKLYALKLPCTYSDYTVSMKIVVNIT